MSGKVAQVVAVDTTTRSKMPSMPVARSAGTKAPSSTSTTEKAKSGERTATATIRIRPKDKIRSWILIAAFRSGINRINEGRYLANRLTTLPEAQLVGRWQTFCMVAHYGRGAVARLR